MPATLYSLDIELYNINTSESSLPSNVRLYVAMLKMCMGCIQAPTRGAVVDLEH